MGKQMGMVIAGGDLSVFGFDMRHPWQINIVEFRNDIYDPAGSRPSVVVRATCRRCKRMEAGECILEPVDG